MGTKSCKLREGEISTQVKPCIDLCMLNIRQFISKDEIYCNNYYLSLDEAISLHEKLDSVIIELERRKNNNQACIPEDEKGVN